MNNPVTGGLQVWGVRSLIPAACGLGCLAFAGWLILANSAEDRLVAGAGMLVTAISAALLLTMRRRLVADDAGLTVRGPGGARRVSWTQVVAIDAPTRRRRGLASTSVELDLDDDGLILLGKTELGADPSDVAHDLRQWWTRSRPGSGG